ncbi:MAG TPA: VOC family protein [Candidatus Dormibacteraeota bacterium]|nr:VOC family protein [Candidatus Dormibacteraeota bacterium]
MRLNHVLLYVEDVGKSLDFYERRLGFKRVEVGLPDYARVLAPDGYATIGLHLVSRQPTPPWNEGLRLYLEVEELDSFCASLAADGVEFEQMPEDMPWGWRHAYLKDPDGHLLSLYRAGPRRLTTHT